MTAFYNEIASGVLKIVLALIGLAFTSVVLPWLKGTVVPWLKEKRIYDMVVHFVCAAEKLADTGALDKDKKKRFVLNLLSSKGIVVTPEVEAMIESAVEELDVTWAEVFADVTVETTEECEITENEDDTEHAVG